MLDIWGHVGKGFALRGGEGEEMEGKRRTWEIGGTPDEQGIE